MGVDYWSDERVRVSSGGWSDFGYDASIGHWERDDIQNLVVARIWRQPKRSSFCGVGLGLHSLRSRAYTDAGGIERQWKVGLGVHFLVGWKWSPHTFTEIKYSRANVEGVAGGGLMVGYGFRL